MLVPSAHHERSSQSPSLSISSFHFLSLSRSYPYSIPIPVPIPFIHSTRYFSFPSFPFRSELLSRRFPRRSIVPCSLFFLPCLFQVSSTHVFFSLCGSRFPPRRLASRRLRFPSLPFDFSRVRYMSRHARSHCPIHALAVCFVLAWDPSSPVTPVTGFAGYGLRLA